MKVDIAAMEKRLDEYFDTVSDKKLTDDLIKSGYTMSPKKLAKMLRRNPSLKISLIDKCCSLGTYECQVPMPITGRRQDIDICIADIVAALNAANITTVASCCGHMKTDAVISLEDGREIIIKWEKEEE